jgi:hypothetical protein
MIIEQMQDVLYNLPLTQGQCTAHLSGRRVLVLKGAKKREKEQHL